ncbi:hypothetical protein V9T40_001756 [Parthenolecanium corni]|uniref:Uncharacterized protein n=1 Tax=Parthenolecanium corni TaxID=536013 RepID=A0AAN9TEX9_9HEMI
MLSARTRSSKFTIVCSTILQHRQKPSPLPDRDHRPSKRNNGRPAGFSRASADRATGVSSTTYRIVWYFSTLPMPPDSEFSIFKTNCDIVVPE